MIRILFSNPENDWRGWSWRLAENPYIAGRQLRDPEQGLIATFDQYTEEWLHMGGSFGHIKFEPE